MREFSADYLARTREGMWADSRDALAPLDLDSRGRVLDVGCGTGELTRVLAAETPSDCEVVGCDADTDLLRTAREAGSAGDGNPLSVVAGDALQLPFLDDSFDLVVCQALLINLPDPAAALREFARVSADLVAAIEPDNGAVEVDSSVDAEERLANRARRAYLDGVETDVTLGADARAAFADAGLAVTDTARYEQTLTVAPPYDDAALAAARRKATGTGLDDDRATMLAGAMTPERYDRLRTDWREMGRAVVDQMADRAYYRQETVPFFVTAGSVSGHS